jgi:hypothetical protein
MNTDLQAAVFQQLSKYFELEEIRELWEAIDHITGTADEIVLRAVQQSYKKNTYHPEDDPPADVQKPPETKTVPPPKPESARERARQQYTGSGTDQKDAADAADAAKSYKAKGNSPIRHRERGVVEEDILLGDGFLERGTACLLAGSSGIGKSSVAMQMGCCWSCGKPAFCLGTPRPLRIVMVQNEDSNNDLARMSEVTRHLGLDESLIDKNFWIETLRGKVGPEAVSVMRDLMKWHRADMLLINPLSAYHSGDISNNKDNIAFLYGELGALLAESRCGIFGFHHKGKPPKNLNQQNNKKAEDIYFEIMYDILGGSVLTNFFRGIIAVSPIGNSEVFRFALAKRFLESGWDQKFQMFKWHEDREKRLWVPANFAESDKAKTSGKTLEDLYKLAPVLGTIPRETFEHAAVVAGFTRTEYRGLLAQTLDDSTPDELRLYQWSVYNPHGLAKAYYSRIDQPADETHAAIKEAEAQKRKAAQKAEAEAAKAAKKAKSQPEK